MDTRICCCGLDNGRRSWSRALPGAVSSDAALSELSSISMANSEGHLDYGDERVTETTGTNRRRSLRASICLKLSIFVGLLVMIAAGVPVLVLWIKAHEQLVEEIRRRLVTVSTLRQEQLKEYLLSEMDKTELIATRVIINNYLTTNDSNTKALAEFDLKSAVEVISDFKHAAIYDRNGRLDITTNVSAFESEINAQTIQSEKLKLAFPILTSNGWIYNISKAIFENETFIGVLMTWVNATKLEDLVYDRTGLQDTGEILVGLSDNSSSAHLLFPPLRNPNLTEVPKEGAIARAIIGESGVLTELDYSGSKVIVAYRPVGFMHWGLLAKLKVYEAYSPVRSVRTVIIITIVLLVFFGVLASVGLAKIFTSPITELGKAAVALGQNDMRARVKEGTVLLRDEIGDLKDMFNSMARQIASHQSILEHKVRERTADLARANDGLAKEIEERRRIEVELEKAKDIAIAANRSKSEFLANMSHEIRTPLNAIINFTELCLDTRITPEQQEHLDYVRFAAQHLLRLITDILDFSKIEAGKLEMEEIQFSLFDQLEHAVSVLATRALKNGLELCCCFDDDVPEQLLGDPGRLLQIFVNLIGNGIKFTRKGEVVIYVYIKDKGADAVELLFAVKDTGLGIPASKQSLLFQAFSQVDSSTQRLYGGTGLGLVISSRLATAMGGKMWVESDGIEDHGSTFWFTAKFRLPPACSITSKLKMDEFKDAKALVVDDNATSLQVFVNLLKNWGIKADGVQTVESAVFSLERAAESGQKYNVVLLDMWLSGTDSVELIKLLRERPNLVTKYCPTQSSEGGDSAEYPLKVAQAHCRGLDSTERGDELNEEKPSIFTKIEKACITSPSEVQGQPLCQKSHLATSYTVSQLSKAYSIDGLSSIIMLTSVNHTDTNRCRELGIKIHTSKPVKRSLLWRLLHAALGTQEKLPILEGKVPKGSETLEKSLHILVAEDNVVNQKVALLLLQKWGHTVVLARNGAEAVEQTTKEAFDLILMDVQMPICDGFEATLKIRELEKAQNKTNTPIVAMTAHAMSGDGDRCIAAGMDYYISKPLNAKKLQELIQNVAIGSLKRRAIGLASSSSIPLW